MQNHAQRAEYRLYVHLIKSKVIDTQRFDFTFILTGRTDLDSLTKGTALYYGQVGLSARMQCYPNTTITGVTPNHGLTLFETQCIAILHFFED